MANLTAQTTQVIGTDLTPVTPTASDTVPVGSRLIVRNGSGAGVTITIVTPGNDTYGQARPDIPKTVAAGAVTILGPFGADLADPITGVVTITSSAQASVQYFVVAF